MTRAWRLLTLLPLLSLFLALRPLVVSAANSDTCCTCVRTAVQNDPISCVIVPVQEGGAGCGALSGLHPNLEGYTCSQPDNPDQSCASKFTSASGICLVGPIDVKAFTPPAKAENKIGGLTVPQLNIPIPGLSFTDAIDVNSKKLSIPFFAQYISAIYRYLISFSAIAAAVMIVYGGFLMIVAQTGAKVRQGREIITDAIIGLFLVLSAYLILNAINPTLTQPGALELTAVSTELYDNTAAVKKLAEAAATVPDSSDIQVPIVDVDAGSQGTTASPTAIKNDTQTPGGSTLPPGTVAKDGKGNLIAQGSCPAGMIAILPSGQGAYGKVKPFCIDIYEAPNVAGKVPFSAVTEWEADWYCNESGKRLCSASEWQRACLGPQGTNTYGYGPKFIEGAFVSAKVPNAGTINPTHNPPAPCNYDTIGYSPLPSDISFYFANSLGVLKKAEYSMLSTANPWALDPKTKERYEKFQAARAKSNFAEPSGKRAGCVTAEGVYDMTGNVQEIVASDRGAQMTTDERIGLGPQVSGSSKPYNWMSFYWSPIAHLANTSAEPTCTVAWGQDHKVNERGFENGFRCCMNLQP